MIYEDKGLTPLVSQETPGEETPEEETPEKEEESSGE